VRRREFVAFVGAAAACPFVARAQQRVGINRRLCTSAVPSDFGAMTDMLRSALIGRF